MAKKVKEKEVVTMDTIFQALNDKYKEGVYKGVEIARKDKIFPGAYSLITPLKGGFVKGKIIEIFGPESSGKSTFGYSLMSQVDGVKGFIDAESAYEKETAELYGVDTSNMIVQRPGYIEEGMQMVLDMVDSGMEFIMFDSIAGAVPKAELEGNMEDHNVGKKAARMGQFMRKLHLRADEKSCTVFFVNQQRDSMSQYGCLHGETLVQFSDGKSIPIKDIVENKIKGKVLSMGPTGHLWESEILDWHDNGLLAEEDNWYTIKCSNGDNKNGVVAVTVTGNHKILTSINEKYQRFEWTEAKNIKPGMNTISWTKSKLNGDLLYFMAGAFAGDSPIIIRSKNTAAFTIRESDNPEYIQWKVSKIAPFYKMSEYKPGYAYISPYDVEIADYRKKYGNRSIKGLADNFTWMGMAIWYMDDGTFNEKRNRLKISARRSSISDKDRNTLLNKLKEWGLNDCKFGPSGLSITKYSAYRFYENIKEYIPDCMQYKLPKEFRGYYIDFNLYNHPTFKTTNNVVLSVNTSSKKKLRSKRKYDITVADNHNYIAGGLHSGIVVHNSPVTTPGGHALKFHASYRIWIKGTPAIVAGGNQVGHYMKMNLKKNKFGIPNVDVMVPLIYGYGISPEWELLQLAVDSNIINKSGSWYSYDGGKLGQGEWNVFTLMLDNPDLTEELKNKLFNH